MQFLRTQEVEHADENVARSDQFAPFFLALASTSALDQVLTLDDSSSSASDTLRRARRYCGRWLALRRLDMGLSNQLISERTGVDAQTLLMLELGLTEAQRVTDDMAERLSGCLGEAHDDAAFVAAVIDVARGRSLDQEGVVMEQVMHDLEPTLESPEDD